MITTSLIEIWKVSQVAFSGGAERQLFLLSLDPPLLQCPLPYRATYTLIPPPLPNQGSYESLNEFSFSNLHSTNHIPRERELNTFPETPLIDLFIKLLRSNSAFVF